ncbi:putative DNA ligase [Candidatus Dependentiae bacterium Noda2021]|nr:putative DNA ligase [Candidatus Dependentiae bacterium Noda2021]
MLFKDLAHAFLEIEKESSRLGMTRLLAGVLTDATSQEADIISNISLGQLRAPFLGYQFNIAEKNIIKVFAEMLKKSEQEIDAQAKIVGDLGLVIEQEIWSTAHDLTVTQVYEMLEQIEKISGLGSQEEKSSALQHLLLSLDPLSAKYVVRVILGTLRLGFSDMTLIDALSWMEAGDKSLRHTIEHAYNICADIGYIAKLLKTDGIEALKKMVPHVGTPIRPAGAERLATPSAIFEKLGPCIAQPKLDGFRLQIHLDKTKTPALVKFYSRNLIDMSHMFPDLAQAVLDLNVQTLIAEGEAIVFDANTGSFLPFQETVKRKRKHGIEKAMEELPLQVFMFDVLYLNGKSLLPLTHETRRAQLMTLFGSADQKAVKIIEEVHINNAKELEHYFAKNISAGLEGLVVKRPDAIYQPGKRNFNWIKLKRSEEGHLDDTIDCVILGYYSGSGKRASFGVGAFLVGVYNPHNDSFETVAKIGTGLKDSDWVELKSKCDQIQALEKPKNVICSPELSPDVWVNPEIVCMIRADEITVSPLHAAARSEYHLGYALRFPRFMGYRPDKGPLEATTAQEIITLYNQQFNK